MRSTRPRQAASRSSRACRAWRTASGRRAHELLTAPALLRDQPGPLEHGDVLLHGGEAHRVGVGEPGDGLLPVDRAAQDVAAGGVGQCVEQAVDCLIAPLLYNHLVVVSTVAPRPSVLAASRDAG